MEEQIMSENKSCGCDCNQQNDQEVNELQEVLCGCHGVTKQDVQNAIKNGVKTFEELQKLTAIGTDCPPCTESSKEYFQQQLVK